MGSIHQGAILLLLSAALLVAPNVPLGPLDVAADDWFEEAVISAGAAYATVRLMNGSVSVLKESELGLEPAGVGVSLAVGQVLDPLDDMTERLSDVIVAALVAIGVQRVLHQSAAEVGTPLLGVLVGLLGLLYLLPTSTGTPGRFLNESRRVLRLVTLFLVAARLASPVAAVTSREIHAHYLAPDIERAQKTLNEGLVELGALVDLDAPSEGGIIGVLQSAGEFVKARVDAFREAMGRLRNSVDDLIGALVTLTGLYFAAFLLQGVLFPLMSFGLIWLIGRALYRSLLGANEPKLVVQQWGPPGRPNASSPEEELVPHEPAV